MLQRLKIQGFTLLDDVTFDLSPGLNVLSGETGAGKSLVLGALGLLLGARTPAACVREGRDAALIEAQFQTDGGGVRLSRLIRRSGRGACLVGDEAVSVSRLAEAGKRLLCFAFQHAQIEIGSAGVFLAGLDELAKQTHVVREYAASYADLLLARAEVSRVRAELAGRDTRQRLVRDQVAQLEKLAPRPGEHSRLGERLRVLRRAQHYLELAAQVENMLSDREPSLCSELSSLIRVATRVADDAPQARALCEALQRAALELEEALRAAERLRADLDVEATDLEALELRFAELDRVAQALGVSGDALSERLEALRQEATLLEGAEERAGFAEAEVEAASKRALALAQTLHAGRSKHAVELTRRIEAELSALCLQGARVELSLAESAPTALGPLGVTLLEARFAANPGEPFGPLAEVASGGERSRLLLALRCAGLEAGAATLVFDEIDAGVGGAAADAIAIRLRRAAESRQIVCITHQACVAARAASHFRVHKLTTDGRTRTEVERLSSNARVDELVRMLSGARTESARRLALELVQAARAEQAA